MEEGTTVMQSRPVRTTSSRIRAACWRCYHYHRACDGNRPCSRCIVMKKESECRETESEDKIIQHKRKKEEGSINNNQVGEEKEKEGDEIIKRRKSGRTSRGNYFFVVDPRSFSVAQPCITPFTSSPQQQPQHSPPLDPMATELTHQIQQLNSNTKLLLNELSQIHDTLASATTQTTTTISANLFNLPPSSSSSFFLIQPDSQPTRFQMISEDLSPQPEELSQNLFDENSDKEEQLEELPPIMRKRPLPDHHLRWKDANQFGQSMFTPFVLQNPDLPFFVYNLLGDFQPLAQAMATGSAFKVPFQAILLATNASFPPLFQYNEDELSGQNLNKLAGPLIRIVESPDLLQRLAPQPLNPTFLVGPVMTSFPSFRARDGTFIHGEGTMQFFYSPDDGRVSFIIQQYHKFVRSNKSIHPSSPFQPRSSPSATPSIFIVKSSSNGGLSFMSGKKPRQLPLSILE